MIIDVKQMRADMAAGTPGPWRHDGPHWNAIIWSDADNRIAFMAHSNGLDDDRDEANASRIARLPDLEAAYLALVEENAWMRKALVEISDRHIPDQPAAFGGDELQWAQRQHGQLRAIARAALGETK